MRIARVLYAPDDEPPIPRLALERDGALYDVGTLDRIFGTPYDPDLCPGAEDFHTRVLALGGAGLDALDARLLAGERPSDARLLPGTFLWLPPCDPDRALYVQLSPYEAPAARPSHRVGNARGLLGHEAAVVFPAEEDRPDPELGIAALIREDLCCASPAEAERAILGYAILNAWCGRDDEACTPGASRRVPAQLGPVLVTAGDVGDVGRLRAQARIDGQVAMTSTAGGWTFSPAESIAWVSRWIDLRAGDVIGLGCVRGGTGLAPRYGSTVELLVERLGKLTGRPVRG